MTRILVPLDFSPHSRLLLKYASDLAVQCGAELHVLHVLTEQVSSVPIFEFGLALPQTVHEDQHQAEWLLAELIRTECQGTAPSGTMAPGVPVGPETDQTARVTQAVRDGSPLLEIVHYAREQQIDLIVVSTHGRTGLSHVLMGSVAESIIRSAPCPVLTMRHSELSAAATST